MLFANFFLFVLNYYSVLSLNILYSELIFLILSITSLIFGIYYTVYKHKTVIDLRKSLSIPGMICFISLLLLYIFIILGLKFNIFSDYFSKLENIEIIRKIYCEESGGKSINVDSKLKAAETNKITSSEPSSSKFYIGSNANNNVVAGDNATISNVNVNSTPGTSQPQVKSTFSKKELITTTFLSNVKSGIRTQTTVREELTTIYGNSSNNSSKSSLSFYFNEAFNMFNNPLKGESLERSTELSLRILGKTKEDSPFLREGIGGIINNLDQYKDLPPVNTQNNTPLSQLSGLPFLNQVSPVVERCGTGIWRDPLLTYNPATGSYNVPMPLIPSPASSSQLPTPTQTTYADPFEAIDSIIYIFLLLKKPSTILNNFKLNNKYKW
jgi:hypothetical protein